MTSTKIRLWGNCPSVRLGKREMEIAGFHANDEVDLETKNGEIKIIKSTPKTFEELIDGASPYSFDDWVDFGNPVENEIW